MNYTKTKKRYLFGYFYRNNYICKNLIIMNEFKIGDIVCLTFDKTKRFLVTNNKVGEDRVELCYFSESENGLKHCVIPQKFLILAHPQE